MIKLVAGAATVAVTVAVWFIMLAVFPETLRRDAIVSASAGIFVGVAIFRLADRLGWVKPPDQPSAVLRIRD